MPRYVVYVNVWVGTNPILFQETEVRAIYSDIDGTYTSMNVIQSESWL